MASKGPVTSGTDGTDFLHRQTVATHYQISAINKARLKFCICMHYLLFGLMLTKLSDDILDRFDVFILELQELYIPKPRLWEWLWASSVLFTFNARKAIRKNNSTSMKIFVVMTIVFAVFPVLYATGYYFNDLWTFIDTRDATKTSEVWQGYPLALMWYMFLIVTLQVHAFEIFFAWKLIRSWMVKRAKKE